MIWLEKFASEIRHGDIIIRNVVQSREFEDDAPYGAFFVERVEMNIRENYMCVWLTRTTKLKLSKEIRSTEPVIIYDDPNEIVTYAEPEEGEQK